MTARSRRSPGDLLERVQIPDGETELELAKTPGEIIDDYGIEIRRRLPDVRYWCQA